MNQPLVVWLVLSLIWGSTWLFIKIGLHDLPPFTYAGLRFLIAAPVLWGVAWWRGGQLPRRQDWPKLAFTGLLSFALNYGLIFWGQQRIGSGLAAVLQAMIPAFAMFFAHFLLPGEPITPRKLGGVALGLLGTGVIFYNQLTLAGAAALAGSVAIFLSTLTASFSSVLVKKDFQHLAPEVLAASQTSCGVIPLLAAGWLFEGNPFSLHWTWAAVSSLIYLALVGSALAFLLFYWLVQQMEVTKVMLISLVTPVLALLLGHLTLNEQITWRIGLGSLAIIAGVGLILVQRVPAQFPQKRHAHD
jgi:drug/metabolite transporter (DMT)-like permease